MGDLVEGLILCTLRADPGKVYNLVSDVETTINELAELINQFADNASSVKYLPGREWDRSRRRVGCIEKSREQLGFQARTTLRAGLEETIEWTRIHMDFIEQIMLKHGRFLPPL